MRTVATEAKSSAEGPSGKEPNEPSGFNDITAESSREELDRFNAFLNEATPGIHVENGEFERSMKGEAKSIQTVGSDYRARVLMRDGEIVGGYEYFSNSFGEQVMVDRIRSLDPAEDGDMVMLDLINTIRSSEAKLEDSNHLRNVYINHTLASNQADALLRLDEQGKIDITHKRTVTGHGVSGLAFTLKPEASQPEPPAG